MAAPTELRRAPSSLLVGTVVWITSEVIFFGTLFGAWFSLRSSNPGDWPPAGVELDLLLPTVGTALLVSSSVTVQLATRPGGAARRWLLATVALGAAFLALLAAEWSSLEFAVDDHAYATAFYALTGFHGLHVAAGLVAMLVLQRAMGTGRVRHDALEVISYYWHFVDVVWLALFASVYLGS